ncbi:synaptic vesicle glycoprotein 2B-like [Musca vetustissima]|uniref:synaptic vesicle glycoprotein 2B-like n=1 Tax=Musca vetustissima TaxID=27455 RepID=UPI002AB6D95F|nr:synaptic vesicle glycoprotein 2B-like [Musca vetustissima]
MTKSENAMDKKENSKIATINEALEKTHFGRFNKQIIIFSGVILNNVILESVGISFALPVVSCDLDLSYQEQGILGAICFLGIIISSHFWGLLADTLGRKRIMMPNLFLGFLVTLISSFSVNFTMVVVLRFLNGVFISASSATIYAYMGEFHCEKHRNRAVLYGSFIAAFSAVFFPLIAWFFINQEWEFVVPLIGITYKPWRLFFVMSGVSGLVCGIIFHYLPESPKYLLTANRHDEALEVLRYMHKKNTEANKKLQNESFEITTLLPDLADIPKVVTETKTPQKKSFTSICLVIWNQTAPLFMRQHIRKTFLSSAILFTTFFTAHGVYMWFPFILNNVSLYVANYDEPKRLCEIIRFSQSSNFTINEQSEICVTKLEIDTYKHTMSLEIIYVTLLLLVIYANRRFGRIPILCIVLTLCGVCGVLSLLIDIPMASIYLFLIMLCSGLGTNVMNAIVVDIYPTSLRAMAVCISLMVGRIGSVTGSNVLGALIETHCEEALYTSSFALVAAAILALLMPKAPLEKKKNPSIEEAH